MSNNTVINRLEISFESKNANTNPYKHKGNTKINNPLKYLIKKDCFLLIGIDKYKAHLLASNK